MKKKITAKSIFGNLDAIICGATLTACLILVNVNVIFRYFLNNPINWTDEVVTSLFVWTVFMGSAYAHRRKAHLGVEFGEYSLRQYRYAKDFHDPSKYAKEKPSNSRQPSSLRTQPTRRSLGNQATPIMRQWIKMV